MALVLASHTEPVEEMKAVMDAAGLKASVDDPNAPPVEVADPEKPSEQPAQPGDTPAAAGGESDPASEAGTKPQEKQVETPPAAPKETKPADHLSRGNFKSKLGKLEDRVSRLSDELDTERGDKTRLRKQLEDAEAELATFKKPVEVDAKKSTDPVEPTLPSKASLDFDEDKYEEAMRAYHTQMLAYSRAVARKEIDDHAAKVDAERKAEKQAAEVDRVQSAFATRMADGLKDIPGLSARLDQWEGDVDLPRLVEQYMMINAKKPADLMNFFAGDAIDDDSAELHRIAGLSDVEQIQALTLLEARLVREREEKVAKPAEQAAPVVDAAPPPPVAPPARPKPAAKPPVEPIETLGSRSSGAAQTLEKAASKSDYFRLRNSGVNR